MDMRRPLDVRAPIRSPESDSLDLNRHVHARVYVGPIFGDVLQHPSILAFPVSTANQRRLDNVPECTLGNAILPSLLPFLSLLSQLLLYSVVLINHRREVTEEDEGHDLDYDDKEDDGHSDRSAGGGPFIGCDGRGGGGGQIG